MLEIIRNHRKSSEITRNHQKSLEIKKSLELINLNPKLYPKKYDTHLQFAPVKVFPFIVVYWFDENLKTVFVTSIFHTNRNPEKFENE